MCSSEGRGSRVVASVTAQFCVHESVARAEGTRDVVARAKRQRGDLNPCGQSPTDFESITLTTRSHCPD